MPDNMRSSRSEPGSVGFERLRAALDRLVAAGTITPAQAAAVRQEVASDGTAPGTRLARPTWTTVLAEIGGYVGGAFVFGAAAVLVSDNWKDLSTAARLAVLDVPAVLLLVAALLVARSEHGPGGDGEAEQGARGRVVATFTAVAAALLGFGSAVIVDARHASDDWSAAVGFWTAFAVLGVGYALRRGALLHVGSGFALTGAVTTSLSARGDWDVAPNGWAMVLLGVAWGVATATGLLREREFGFGWAGLIAFVGGEMLVAASLEPAGYPILVLLSIAGLVGFVLTRAFALLVTGVGTLAIVVPQGVIDATNGALGAAGALLVVGLSIVGASVLGLRLRRATPFTLG